jgi:hypothetical protein
MRPLERWLATLALLFVVFAPRHTEAAPTAAAPASSAFSNTLLVGSASQTHAFAWKTAFAFLIPQCKWYDDFSHGSITYFLYGPNSVQYTYEDGYRCYELY